MLRPLMVFELDEDGMPRIGGDGKLIPLPLGKQRAKQDHELSAGDRAMLARSGVYDREKQLRDDQAELVIQHLRAAAEWLRNHKD